MKTECLSPMDEAKLEVVSDVLHGVTGSASQNLAVELAALTRCEVGSAMTRIFGPDDEPTEYTGELIRAVHDALQDAVKNAVHATVVTLERELDGFEVVYRARDESQHSLYITDLSERYWEAVNT